jgi:hypothetical protein
MPAAMFIYRKCDFIPIFDPDRGLAVKLRTSYFCKYLVFGLKAHYTLDQWQHPERTTPWVK